MKLSLLLPLVLLPVAANAGGDDCDTLWHVQTEKYVGLNHKGRARLYSKESHHHVIKVRLDKRNRLKICNGDYKGYCFDAENDISAKKCDGTDSQKWYFEIVPREKDCYRIRSHWVGHRRRALGSSHYKAPPKPSCPLWYLDDDDNYDLELDYDNFQESQQWIIDNDALGW